MLLVGERRPDVAISETGHGASPAENGGSRGSPSVAADAAPEMPIPPGSCACEVPGMLPLRRPRDVTRYLSRPVSSAPQCYPSMTRLWEDTPRASLTRPAQAAFGQVVLAARGDRDESVLG